MAACTISTSVMARRLTASVRRQRRRNSLSGLCEEGWENSLEIVENGIRSTLDLNPCG